ncbi:hypothetical protein AAGS61_04670 [Lysinibacillus sp. KU-BSD001]|uniref:hypothetical protein n=1 Tax=Lysinibacillus sp. KU-BSD001 TaxID=3141328 RepID=UPI0036EE425D
MNKMVMALVTTGLLLTACQGTDEKSNEVAEENTQTPQTGEEQSAQNVPNASNDEQWASLPEYHVIMEQIGTKDYNVETVTDNEEKRILLISDESGESQYKTIFIKQTQRLKIIEMGEDGQIFNDILPEK